MINMAMIAIGWLALSGFLNFCTGIYFWGWKTGRITPWKREVVNDIVAAAIAAVIVYGWFAGWTFW